MKLLRKNKFLAYLILPIFLCFVLVGLLLTKTVTRNKKIWIFGSYSDSFNDNSKYLFIYLTEKQRDIKAIWITNNKDEINRIRSSGGLAYSRWSPAGIYYSLRGGVWFYTSYASNINFLLWHGAVLVNLWHGIPFKKIEFDIDSGPLFNILSSPTIVQKYMLYANFFIKPNFVISTSKYVSDYSFSSAFRIKSANVLPLGNPRLDCLFWSKNETLLMLNKWGFTLELDLISEFKKFKKVILYMPTWRDDSPDFLSKNEWDFNLLNDFLRGKDLLLIIKLHVNTPKDIIDNLKYFSNIKVIPNKVDLYPILNFSDVLITDYSSIYFDYLLLRKQILLFCFDLENYLKKSRSTYFDYDDIYGLKIKTFNELLDYIQDLGSYDTFSRNQISSILNRFFDDTSGNYSEKITNYFLNNIVKDTSH